MTKKWLLSVFGLGCRSGPCRCRLHLRQPWLKTAMMRGLLMWTSP